MLLMFYINGAYVDVWEKSSIKSRSEAQSGSKEASSPTLSQGTSVRRSFFSP